MNPCFCREEAPHAGPVISASLPRSHPLSRAREVIIATIKHTAADLAQWQHATAWPRQHYCGKGGWWKNHPLCLGN